MGWWNETRPSNPLHQVGTCEKQPFHSYWRLRTNAPPNRNAFDSQVTCQESDPREVAKGVCVGMAEERPALAGLLTEQKRELDMHGRVAVARSTSPINGTKRCGQSQRDGYARAASTQAQQDVVCVRRAVAARHGPEPGLHLNRRQRRRAL
jgi:hypothetical protein